MGSADVHVNDLPRAHLRHKSIERRLKCSKMASDRPGRSGNIVIPTQQSEKANFEVAKASEFLQTTGLKNFLAKLESLSVLHVHGPPRPV